MNKVMKEEYELELTGKCKEEYEQWLLDWDGVYITWAVCILSDEYLKLNMYFESIGSNCLPSFTDQRKYNGVPITEVRRIKVKGANKRRNEELK